MIQKDLMKNYEDVARIFDKFKGSDEIFSKKSIEEYMRDNGIEPHTFFLPSDMCYNHTTKPLGNGDDDFEAIPHVFEYLGRNKYRVLGKDCPYTGVVSRTRKEDRKEVIVGEWLNGHLIKWDKSKQLDLDDFESESRKLAGEIENEIEILKLQGEDKKALVKVRVNQGIFRERLLRRYSHCCLCNVSCKDLLRASHIKPWAACDPEEKLDVNNGFLLCPNHDTVFDKGYISFDDKGNILISGKLSKADKVYLNIHEDMKIEICEENKKYLTYHRKNVFSD